MFRVLQTGPVEVLEELGSGRRAQHLRDPGEVVLPESRLAARQRWPSLSYLARCLPDPFATPPAQDPAGFRKLVVDPAPHWRIELSGLNPCSLAGELLLPLSVDRADPRGLQVDGTAWADGGQERLVQLLNALQRERVREVWPMTDPAQRLLALRELERDPLAGPVLRWAAAQSAGVGVEDAAAALDRWVERHPEADLRVP